jgi:hypothetical protein
MALARSQARLLMKFNQLDLGRTGGVRQRNAPAHQHFSVGRPVAVCDGDVWIVWARQTGVHEVLLVRGWPMNVIL